MAQRIVGILTLLILSSAFSDTVFPIRQGTKWVLDHQGQEQSRLVESLTKVTTKNGIVHVAVIRRSDGTDRLLIRTEEEWLECEPTQTNNNLKTCHNPFSVIRWPLTQGQRWTSGGFDFVVIKTEPITVPYKSFPSTWRISYTPSGGSDPIGEFWFAPGLGQVRIQEGQSDFSLVGYEPGEGPELQTSPMEAVGAFLEEPQNISIPPYHPSLLQQLMGAFRYSKLFPLFMFQLVVTALVVLIGFSIWGAFRKSKETAKDSDLKIDTKEEAKLLSMVAKSGDLDRAKERLTEMVKEHPQYPDLRHQLALIQKLSGEFDQAEKSWSEAIRLNPKYVDAHLGLANLLLATGSPEKALFHFEEVTQLKPEFVDAHIGKGRSLELMGDKEKAIDTYEKALARFPGHTEIERLLGECRNPSQAQA